MASFKSCPVGKRPSVSTVKATTTGKSYPAGIDGPSLLDLTESVRDGILTWDAPDGSWRVMTFSWEHVKGKRVLVDGARTFVFCVRAEGSGAAD